MFNLIKYANFNLCKNLNVLNTIRQQRLQSTIKVNCDEKKKEAPKPPWWIWRQLSLFLAIPIVVILTISNHYQKMDHPERLPYIPFEHLNLHVKRHPWNRTTSFLHNHEVNPIPGYGYEDEIEGPWTDRYDDGR